MLGLYRANRPNEQIGLKRERKKKREEKEKRKELLKRKNKESK